MTLDTLSQHWHKLEPHDQTSAGKVTTYTSFQSLDKLGSAIQYSLLNK